MSHYEVEGEEVYPTLADLLRGEYPATSALHVAVRRPDGFVWDLAHLHCVVVSHGTDTIEVMTEEGFRTVRYSDVFEVLSA